MHRLDSIDCPLCGSTERVPWGIENNYTCVRCSACGLLYVNPRPGLGVIGSAVALGSHTLEDGKQLTTRATRDGTKKKRQSHTVRLLFYDMLQVRKQVRWLDIGAGYGEFVEVLRDAFPPGSTIRGIEPMQHKVKLAQQRALPVRLGNLQNIDETYDVVSLIDVFSHIPDFADFLDKTKLVLRPDGEILIKSGNAADIVDRRFFPGPLNLPDHLVFAGLSQLTRFLSEAGFTVTAVRSERIDGVWYSMKNLVKWLLGKPVCLGLPYSSPTRTLWIRAKLIKDQGDGCHS